MAYTKIEVSEKENSERLGFLKELLKNMPEDWLKLTTHRLDIYHEEKAKIEFLDELEKLYDQNLTDNSKLSELPTAYDYIRLGHPLSCVLEWYIAKTYGLNVEDVISFSSQTMPIMAILRKNRFKNKASRLYYQSELPENFDLEVVKSVYGYDIELKKVKDSSEIEPFEGSTIFVSEADHFNGLELDENLDFSIRIHPQLGSILLASGKNSHEYVSEIQHVRRRESVAMTPAKSFSALQILIDPNMQPPQLDVSVKKEKVENIIREITGTQAKPLLGSSGLSVQYAIMMGLVDDAMKMHPGKSIKFIVPPNCYGGTNDQARRVAAGIDHVEIMDLPVDGDHDMVQSIDQVLDEAAKMDAVPYIIAEIPTNPRVEVPKLEALETALCKSRQTADGKNAIDPVFILDQTFCPNIQFLGEGKRLSKVRTISYASGSKFPSGGKCTAGYLVVNQKAEGLHQSIERHLMLCDNQATDHQIEILAEQMPSMIQRIEDAYQNTREFVNFIEKELPEAKINFVSEELANEGFTPSVFSLDLPTQGDTHAQRENYKRALNNKLIGMMINEIPDESKYCVSYGQLKGCYWTIPATSTQGTTKEEDKDYIARVSVSPNLDLEKHKAVLLEFIKGMK